MISHLVVCDGGKMNDVTYGSFKVFDQDGYTIAHKQFVIGYGTTNLSEYMAMKLSLIWCIQNNIKNIMVFSDSALVVNQIVNGWKCNYEHLREERDIIKNLMKAFDKIEIVKINNKTVKTILGH